MILERLGDLGIFSPLDLHFATTVSRLAGETNPNATLGAALASKVTAAGHTCADLRACAGTRAPTPDGSAGDVRWPVLDAWTAVLRCSPLVSQPAHGSAANAPLVLDGHDRLFLARYWEYQERLACQLLHRAGREIGDLDTQQLHRDLPRLFEDTRQTEAARAAATRHLTVISGGPGTGKTTTVVRILALLQQQAMADGGEPLRVQMLAPTGKAAARLSESVRRARDGGLAGRVDDAVLAAIDADAATIHRALRWQPRSPTRFAHDRQSPLSADVVVVDEASMVDLALMTKLVEAVRVDARLILLGDRDQLASVEAGATLGDICAAGLSIQLLHNYRFGAESGIGQLARSINEGDARRALDLLRGRPDLEWLDIGDERGLVRSVSSRIADGYGALASRTDPAAGLDLLGRFRVLAAHLHGPFGAQGLNALAERVLPQAWGSRGRQPWYPGQPVMVLANDYSNGLFNGDVGLIDRTIEGRTHAFFPATDGTVRAIPPSRLPRHQTVYAMTVHKSQGSEFDEVLVVLPPRPSPVITRELLYTAVTRARHKVTVVGPAATIEHAIRTPVQRTSGLRDRLRSP